MVDEKKGRQQRKQRVQGRVTIRTSKKYDSPFFHVGDLVYAMAKDIHHPAVEHSWIDENYIILGMVTGYRTRKWCSGKTEDREFLSVNWQNIEKGGNRYQDYKDGNSVYDDNCRCYNVFVKFDIIHKSKVKLVACCDSSNLDKVNDFIK